jgi:hypothetical protein
MSEGVVFLIGVLVFGKCRVDGTNTVALLHTSSKTKKKKEKEATGIEAMWPVRHLSRRGFLVR